MRKESNLCNLFLPLVIYRVDLPPFNTVYYFFTGNKVGEKAVEILHFVQNDRRDVRWTCPKLCHSERQRRISCVTMLALRALRLRFFTSFRMTRKTRNAACYSERKRRIS